MQLNKLFGKKSVSVDVIDFSAMKVATSQVAGYIKKLYEEEGFSHMGYRVENRNGLVRFIIYTLPSSKEIIQYFKDRCPAMVEKQCMEIETSPDIKWNKWNNGFEEISKH